MVRKTLDTESWLPDMHLLSDLQTGFTGFQVSLLLSLRQATQCSQEETLFSYIEYHKHYTQGLLFLLLNFVQTFCKCCIAKLFLLQCLLWIQVR